MIVSKSTFPAFLAAALLAAPACKSELDDKPAATVKDADSAKAAGEKDDGAADDKDGDKAGDKDAAATKTLALDSAKSSIEFVGAKVTGDHRGSFGSPSGKLEMAGDEVKGFTVEVDTTKLKIEPEKLAQHLASPDFFDVAKYPKAVFTMSEVAAKAGPDGATHEVTGELDLRGVKKTISFPAKVSFSEGGADATASFKINRKDFGIVYAGMPDDLIKDEVLLDLQLNFTA